MVKQRGNAPNHPARPPAFRRLRVFAINPSLDTRLDVALVNQTTLTVPWEALKPGPVGEYIEVVDYDPPSRCFYQPVDLNHPYLLVEDGLAPSEASPQFHQQMVYAVAMVTIGNFEAALGRRMLWAPRLHRDESGMLIPPETVDRLRIYPHALREANSYYSPQKKALLFGYFPAPREALGTNMPGGLVFTCLSSEIVAHETTHALLDGARALLLEPTNPDVLAFHEAFADLVALFQSFSQPETVGAQIARTRGDLGELSLLGELAQQSGRAVNQYAVLRDALGAHDPGTGTWKSGLPDPSAYETRLDPLGRASILVAAVFDAYLAIYRRRVVDLFEVVTQGTGVLPPGPMPPALARWLADEAARVAQHFLRMCIRAIDYCPPVDITYGEFLRALITADRDLVPDDDRGYLPTFVEAFRRWGIYPRHVKTLSVESLCWRQAPADLLDTPELLRNLALGAGPDGDRRRIALQAQANCAAVHRWLTGGNVSPADAATHLGLALGERVPGGIALAGKGRGPRVIVHSVRPAWRAGPDGQILAELLIEISQRRAGYFDPEKQAAVDGEKPGAEPPQSDFDFRGGCTMLVDLGSGLVRYCIFKSILDEDRLDRQRRYLAGSDTTGPRAAPGGRTADEPFADLLRNL